ncbi:ORF6N domain-containing protein, partial [Acidithiobacillus sp. BN09-2]|nr:ORF6N domain-containing protein [Acidithiobacillus sp. BN09-2]
NVILDADLAELYGVTTKRLNEQVKRNLDRFPPDFMFRVFVICCVWRINFGCAFSFQNRNILCMTWDVFGFQNRNYLCTLHRCYPASVETARP